MLKYARSESASTMVVIMGLAMTAGSKPSFEVIIGRQQPMSLAITTTITSVRQITAATENSTLSSRISLRRLASASVSPHSTATLISFQIILNRFSNSISFSERLRIIETLACVTACIHEHWNIGCKYEICGKCILKLGYDRTGKSGADHEE